MGDEVKVEEGFVPFRGLRTWYRLVGGREPSARVPLLVMHGGPGESWDYLEPLEGVARGGRAVCFYDQLGCGNSDVPGDSSWYTMELFVDEVAAVRRALGLDRVHLLGQSWGGMLALEYALTGPEGLVSLILADTAASLPQWAAEVGRLVATLPAEVRQTIAEHEAAGTTDSEEYKQACREFSRRFICRLDPRPECLTRNAGKPGAQVYRAMWGPSEFCVTGTLKDWDVTGRLGEIRVPTLVLGGRHDEATPTLTSVLHRGIPGSDWVIFESSAHLPHLEETARYLEVLGAFLDRTEPASEPR